MLAVILVNKSISWLRSDFNTGSIDIFFSRKFRGIWCISKAFEICFQMARYESWTTAKAENIWASPEKYMTALVSWFLSMA